MACKVAPAVLFALTLALLFPGTTAAAPPDAPTSPSSSLPFLAGGDVSLLAKEEQAGAVYRAADGKPSPDALRLFRDAGWNVVRLRLWVHPTGEGVMVNDLPYTIALGKRVKQARFRLLLDLHYSDGWADPGQQKKPAAWQNLSFADLTTQVETYSRETVAAMRAGGAMPDLVQVGNETTNGMLWPDGHVEETGGWAKYATLTRAAIKGVRAGAIAPAGAGNLPAPKIVIHIANSGQAGLPEWFFGNLTKAAPDLDFDIIGLSYYPDGKATLADLKRNMATLATTYGKPLLIAETAFPHAGTAKADQPVYAQYGLTPDGQRRYLADLIAMVRATPNGLGLGVVYWEPEWIGRPAVPQYWGQNPLFDDRYVALPGLSALSALSATQEKPNPTHP